MDADDQAFLADAARYIARKDFRKSLDQGIERLTEERESHAKKLAALEAKLEALQWARDLVQRENEAFGLEVSRRRSEQEAKANG